VKRLGMAAAVLLLSAMCAAQMASPHGSAPSSRSVFGGECGIVDSSPQSAIGLSRSPEGNWSVTSKDKRPGPNDNAAARVWREAKWMVDLHDAPGDGTTIHTGQMCFDENGHITLLIDRYMDTPKCGCIRYTAMSFAVDGRAVRREQRFMRIDNGAEIEAPEAAKGFPAVFGYRKLDQLPFYSMVKR